MVKKNMTQRTLLALQMLEHVNRQRESGMTIANYAAQVGITTHKLRYRINKVQISWLAARQRAGDEIHRPEYLGAGVKRHDIATDAQKMMKPQMHR